MLSTYGQENLVNAHQTAAASKPLNQSRINQPKTPAAAFKTPFKRQNNENVPMNTGKATTKVAAIATPAPRTEARAPLGAKTTNAKAGQYQTPAPGQKTQRPAPASNRPSTTRRSVKKKIYVAPEPISTENDLEESEPEFGYAPPPITALPDPPLECDFDATYACLRPENFNRGLTETYFHSPKDENGFSISLKKQEEAARESLERDLHKIETVSVFDDSQFNDPDAKVAAMIARGPSELPEANVSTIRARLAADAMAEQRPIRTHLHQRLPSAATRDTAASRQKRKPAATFAVARDIQSSMPPPSSRSTIGFPKAKKAPSILPRSNKEMGHFKSASVTSIAWDQDGSDIDQSKLSPRTFVQQYGQPPVESEMWFRLMELEIQDRRREDAQQLEPAFFDSDDDQDDFDQGLGVQFGGDMDAFELKL